MEKKSKPKANKEDAERKLQEKFVEYQMVQQQVGQVQKKIEQLREQKGSIEGLQQNLNDLKGVEKGSEILVPVCSGIFAKASLLESNELLVNVGNNVVVGRTLAEVKDMLSKQSSEISRMDDHMVSYLQKLSEKAAKIEKELEAMIEEAKKNV